MKRVDGNPNISLIECTNPVKGLWRIRWDVRTNEDNTSYMEEEFDHRPSSEEIKTLVVSWYNQRINECILSGFTWNGMPVWLSSENQFNYKAAYDLAAQAGNAALPVTFKFGTDEEPVYREFSTLDELTEFYVKAMQHVQSALAEGWKMKDAFDLKLYEV